MLSSDPRPGGAPEPTLRYFADGLFLSAGRFPVSAGERVVGPMRRGLKIAVLLDGSQIIGLDNRPAMPIEGPVLLVAANLGEHVQQRTGMVDASMRCALMQLDLDFLDQEFGAQAAPLLTSAGPGGAAVWMRPAGPAIRAIALQMAECAVDVSLRRLYLAGKALELAALALDEVTNSGRGARPRLPSRTRESVHAARDMLLANMSDPPSLAELARCCGLNPTRLTSAFRAEFGTSVFGYLQEQRLLRAQALLLSGEANVAQAAFMVGYTPAHFSGLFHKRFGVQPSSLR